MDTKIVIEIDHQQWFHIWDAIKNLEHYTCHCVDATSESDPSGKAWRASYATIKRLKDKLQAARHSAANAS